MTKNHFLVYGDKDMLVKDIIKKACKLINLSDVLEYLNDETGTVTLSDDVSEKLDRLLLALNLTNNTLSSQYFEISACTECDNPNGVVSFGSITTKNIVEIKKVTDIENKDVEYKVLSDGVHSAYKSLKIYYTYIPDDVVISDSINYYLKLSEITFAYGVVSEYLFLIEELEEASVWDEKFKNILFAISRPRRSIVMPSKGWY